MNRIEQNWVQYQVVAAVSQIGGWGLYTAVVVLVVISLLELVAARRRQKVIEGIAELEATEGVRELGKALISEGPISPQAEVDAYHAAIAAVNGMDYLLTWNCTNIANAAMRPKIEAVCRQHGYEPSIICTPQELMEN